MGIVSVLGTYYLVMSVFGFLIKVRICFACICVTLLTLYVCMCVRAQLLGLAFGIVLYR